MAFPQDILSTRVELNLAGTWTDITSDVYSRDVIQISRGTPNEANRADPSRLDFTLNNRDGKYSPRNPNSPYYGQIGKNTQVRVSLPYSTTYLRLNDTGYADAAHHASLAITGDIDIRIDVEIDNLIQGVKDPATVQQSDLIELCARVSSGANSSWGLFAGTSGKLYFYWTTDGSTYAPVAVSSTPIVLPETGRIALRVTLDVDNGASGHTARFYTSNTISGTWTQLGTDVVAAGVTSIFGGAGITWVGNTFFTNVAPTGGINAFELRNGIGGTVVASPDFTIQTEGATSFNDAQGRTWFAGGGATITKYRPRFVGEIPAWPQKWVKGGGDFWVPMTAQGILRRLGQGTAPITSSLAYRIPKFDPLAYWPMEDGTGSLRAASGIPGGDPMATQSLTFGSVDSLAGSKPLPVLDSSQGVIRVRGAVPAPSPTVAGFHAEMLYNNPTANATERTYFHLDSTGTVASWDVRIGATSTTISGTDGGGVSVVSNTYATGSDLFNAWIRLRFFVVQNGANVDWTFYWIHVGGVQTSVSGSFAGTLGRVTAMGGPTGGYSADLDGMAIGHFATFGTLAVLTAYDGADFGYFSENANDRLIRLSVETGNFVSVTGSAALSEDMGAQHAEAYLDLVTEVAETDLGLLYESRTRPVLSYRPRNTRENQSPTATLNYTVSGQIAEPPEVTDDDYATRNLVTVTRRGGSSSTVEDTTSPLATSAIGVYADSVTANVQTDDRTLQQASWRLHLGTWDEARYPSVGVRLSKATSITDAVAAVDIGDMIRLTNLPSQVGQSTADLIVMGYTETLSQYQWDITFNCVPAGPWNVGFVEDSSYSRADTGGSTLAEALDTTETAVDVVYSAERWVDSPSYAASFPFDIGVGGERMTVTALTGVVYDTFTRSVSGGWGSANTGQAYGLTGTASEFSVSGTQGLMTVATANSGRNATVVKGFTDFDITCQVTTTALATGASLFTSVLGRYTDSSNYYQLRVEFTTANAILISLRKTVAGVITSLATFTTGRTHVASKIWTVRFQGIGTTLRARLWDAATENEDSVWRVSATDSALTSGTSVGCRGIRDTGNTNSPAVFVYDNFADMQQQTMTVTRSVNGIVKAHSIGGSLSLGTPTYASL